MGLDASKIRAILFDIDGTLSDSDDQMVARVERSLSWPLFFLPAPKRRALARWLVMAIESPGNFIYNQADRFDLDGLVIRILNRRSQNQADQPREYWIISGVREMLRRLAPHYRLGVVSARGERTSLAFLRQFELEDFFDVVVTAQTCRYTKPFPHPLIYAAERLDVQPGNCLMVGDTTVDMRAATLAGMQALGVLCGFGGERELRRAGAHLVLPTTTDLLTVPGLLP